MEIRSKTVGVIIVIVIFGGIIGASALGLWKTKSVGSPAKIQISESVGGAYDPAGIRGSYRFGDISEMFDIPLEILSRAFALPVDVDPATFKIQNFDSISPEFEGKQEIGNGSMKWFVALYTGLPFELEDDEEAIYLLRPAVDILKSHAELTAEQIAYLDAYTIEDELQSSDEADGDAEETEPQHDEMVVAGSTIFADLLDWGVPAEKIEVLIGGEIPNRLMLVYNYCKENGLSFGKIKTELQVEVDKLE